MFSQLLCFASLLLVCNAAQLKLQLTAPKPLDLHLISDPLTVPVETIYNRRYTTKIYVGTPMKEFRVSVDTGSPMTWLIGGDCKYKGIDRDMSCPEPHYQPLSSSTSDNPKAKPFEFIYGSGSVKGVYWKDNIGFIDGLPLLQNFAIGVAEQVTPGQEPILGLGMATSQPFPSMIDVLRENKAIEPQKFTIWLGDHAAEKEGGVIVFGDPDTEHCNATVITTVAVVENPWWTFAVNKVEFDGKEFTSEYNAISDTGSTFIAIPAGLYKSLLKVYPDLPSDDAHLRAQTFECDQPPVYLNIKFFIGDQEFSFDSIHLMLPTPNRDICAWGITLSPFSDKWILGQPFIRKYCQIYDYGEGLLSFAEAKHGSAVQNRRYERS